MKQILCTQIFSMALPCVLVVECARARTKRVSYRPPLAVLNQMRETRREQLATLRSKFEKDKARVAKMKEQRKFRPF